MTDCTLMGTQKPTFQKRYYQVSKLQFSIFNSDVPITNRIQFAVAKPIVGSNGTSSRDSFLNKGVETVCRGIRKNTKTNSPNAVISLVFDCDTYEYLTGRPTTSFTRFLSANNGFIYFNNTRQAVPVRTDHGPTQFVQPGPGRAIASQTKDAFKAQSAGSIFLSSYPPYRPKPHHQRLVGILKNCSRYNRQLIVATGTLEQHSTNWPGFRVPTSWTDKAFRPSQTIKVVSTILFRRKPRLKFSQTFGVRFHAPLLYVGVTLVK